VRRRPTEDDEDAGQAVRSAQAARHRVADCVRRRRALTACVANLEGQNRLLTERLGRQPGTLTVERVARELLDVLRRDDPRRDRPERQSLLRDVVAEIEARQESWPE
jgi:hypothetical protein